MPSSEFSPNNVWGSNKATGEGEELTLESGQTCLAQKLSIDGMIKAGLLAEADALTAQMSKYIKKVKTPQSINQKRGKAPVAGSPKMEDQLDEKALLADPNGLTAMMTLMDRALPHIVISPVVKLHFEELTVGKTKVIKTIAPEDRDPDVIYTDQVDFTDKAELFNWAAGGLAALMQFRS